MVSWMNLAAVGRPIFLTDFNLYVFLGFRGELIRDLITNLSTKGELLPYFELYSHLFTHEFSSIHSYYCTVIAYSFTASLCFGCST
jgi:hypothetical protein